MTLTEKKLIKKLNDSLSEDIQITQIVSKTIQNEELSIFCKTLSSLAPRIHIQQKKDDKDIKPAILIGNNLTYHAVPLGTELNPFLKALSFYSKHPIDIDESILKDIETIKLPATLIIFITRHCPFCPKTVEQLIPLSFISDLVKLTIIDGGLFPEDVRTFNIRSAPTVILEDSYRWTENIQISEIVKILKTRDPSQLSASTIENMLSDGNASIVADLMLKNEKIFPGFIDLLVHEKWPVRLGAMVAAEQIIDKNIHLARQSIAPMWERFSGLEDQIKGDIIYIIGESGNMNTIEKLSDILNGPYHKDVKDAARDAIDSINKRH